ncbi:MAG: Unknown protein [uncultured Sulfurovum sp.]|uniref:Uncharacterized protein n=1 Tax=uncultured Sulfurovum sp. TaxID=269237 RepID=A0A6S6SS78_9BACT|nr:MAG: Unknown protein [uncultured Sulfurovum sp.]
MTPAYLNEKLIEACKNNHIDEVSQWLNAGAEPNFNIKKPINALDIAIQNSHHQIIELLLKHGAMLKEYMLQKAIEKDKNYLELLLPNFKTCKEQSLLMGILQAAINTGDLNLAQQAIHQGAKPKSLFLTAILNLTSTDILQLLIENGFNIHADENHSEDETTMDSESSDENAQERNETDGTNSEPDSLPARTLEALH